MSHTYKHEEAWKLHHNKIDDPSLYEVKKTGRRYGNKRRLWARIKVKSRRAWRHALKRLNLD